MLKAAVIGSKGQLGSDLMKVLGPDGVPITHEMCEVREQESVRSALKGLDVDVVINCAAYHNVGLCEDNPKEALLTNALGAYNVAKVCDELGFSTCFISTDYVFDDFGPHEEWDEPNPLNVYGASKLAGEYLSFLANPNRVLVVRTSSLFGTRGPRGKGSNFVETMLRLGSSRKELKVVADLLMSPTYTKDLAEKLIEVLSLNLTGIFHITNSGFTSWKGFAETIFDLVGFEVKVLPCRSVERDKGLRPRNSVLSNWRLKKEGLGLLRHWEEALKDYLEERGYALSNT